MLFVPQHDLEPWQTLPRLRQTRSGMIDVRQGRLERIALRSRPALVTLADAWLLGRLRHRFAHGDRCRLIYAQFPGVDEYLTLQLCVSHRDATIATLHRGWTVLQQIAELKGCAGVVAQITNPRLSDRVLARYGWQRHCLHWPGRHFIFRLEQSGGTASHPRLWAASSSGPL